MKRGIIDGVYVPKTKRSRGNGYRQGVLYAAGMGLSAAGQFLGRAYNKWKKGGNRQSGVTVQNDVTRQYRFKRMPRRKRRQWKKFVKKVQGAAEKNLGTRTVLFNDTIGCTPAILSQDWCFISMYGRGGTTTPKENGNKDLFEIAAQDSEILNTTKVHFKSAVLDVTMLNRNFGETVADTTLMEVDVYEIAFANTEVNFPTLQDTLNNALADTPTIGAGTPINLNTRGATPFALGHFIRLAKAKVLSKKKFLIGAGQAATMQIRMPKNHWVMGRDMAEQNEDFNYKGLTRGYLFVAKNVDANYESQELIVRATRTYTYKTEGPIENQTRNIVL